MPFLLTELYDNKQAMQSLCKQERDRLKKTNEQCPHCTRGYDYMSPCRVCFLGDLVANYMHCVDEYHKAMYG